MKTFRRRLLSSNKEDDDFVILGYITTTPNQTVTLTVEGSYFSKIIDEEGNIIKSSRLIKHTFKEVGIHYIKVIFNEKLTSLKNCFYYCTELYSISPNLFDNLFNIVDFSYCLGFCTSLIGETPKDKNGLELWERAGKPGYPETIIGTRCFQNCTNLSNYAEIPDDWK